MYLWLQSNAEADDDDDNFVLAEVELKVSIAFCRLQAGKALRKA
jgi:hypothetical protein